MCSSRYLFALLICAAQFAFAQPKTESISDGPYVFDAASGIEARWVCRGSPHVTLLSRNGVLKSPCADATRLMLDDKNLVVAPDTLPRPARWAAVSDIHGQHAQLVALLRAHGIINTTNQWAWGRSVLIVVGDVFDRGDTQTEALWLLYRLSTEARQAGGRVELLLGNHEALVLSGDLRYLHPKYPPVATALGTPFADLFGKDTELGRWLRTRATVLKLGDTLFVHGGLHPELISKWPNHAAMNEKIREHLGQPRAERNKHIDAAWLYGRDGPIWFRGYFTAPRVSADDVGRQLAHFGVSRIVVGHTTRSEIVSLYGGKVVGIDAGLKDGKRGELLLWDGKQLSRGLLDGKRIPLPNGTDDGKRALPVDDDH
jgi:hypothetical protein